MKTLHDDNMSMVSQATTTMTFASLPAQLTRKSAKKGFEFNLMIVGESGLGKSTLVSSIFNYDIDNQDKKSTNVEDLLHKKVEIVTNQFDIEDTGVKLKLKVIDCLNYGDALDCTDNYKPIIRHIDEQFAKYFDDENGTNRNQIVDTRIHCLFYFISPLGFGLKPLDREFLMKAHEKVNIVPIIAKADALGPKERESLKRRILNDFAKNNIQIYTIPEPDPDEVDTEYELHSKAIKAAIPFAVCSREKNRHTNGFKDRLYPWGKFDIDNPEHSDFPLLKSMLVIHMSDLKDVTKEVHYETYRCNRLNNENIRIN